MVTEYEPWPLSFRGANEVANPESITPVLRRMDSGSTRFARVPE
jgi:hypothetical protein